MEHPLFRPGLSGTALKRLACISMLIDHIGASCILAGLFPATVLWGETAYMGPKLYILYRILRWIGRVAFPIYCFLLTRANTSSTVYWGHQNVYWTLLLGVGAMVCVRWGTANGGTGQRRLMGVLGAVACAAAAELLGTDYGAAGVALIAVLYRLRSSRAKQCVAGGILVAYELPAPLAFVPVWFYNGQRGQCGQVQKWGFYGFYPVHLFLLGCVTNWIL